VASSAAQLRDATALHNLILIDLPGLPEVEAPGSQAAIDALMECATNHPSLRRLALDASSAAPPGSQAVRDAAISAARRRPSLKFYNLRTRFRPHAGQANDLNAAFDSLLFHP